MKCSKDNHATGADDVNTAVLRKGRENFELMWAAAHAHRSAQKGKMDSALINSVEKFLLRAQKAGVSGELADKNEMIKVNEQLGGIIPEWYIDLITSYPICAMEFQWQAYPEEDDFDGRSNIFWSRPSDILRESKELCPGASLLGEGYFNVACDDDGMGDPYFINANSGNNPPFYEVYHEKVKDPETQVGEFDVRKISERLSDFFDMAFFENE